MRSEVPARNLLRNASRPQSERTRKDITREFKKQGLNTSLSTNLIICNFFDVTLNLTDGTHYPYRKPNNETLYIDTNSIHPSTIIKHLPAAIGQRVSDISSNKELFDKVKTHHESALKQSGHDEKLIYTERKKPSVVYNANVITESDTTGKNYIGLTEGTFKQRYTQHKLSFRNRNYSNSTELSKHIWTLKDNNVKTGFYLHK